MEECEEMNRATEETDDGSCVLVDSVDWNGAGDEWDRENQKTKTKPKPKRKRVSPHPDKDVDLEECPKMPMLLHEGSSSGTNSQFQNFLYFGKAEHDKPPLPAKVEVDSLPVDNVEWCKLMSLLPTGFSCYQPFSSELGKAKLSKPPSPVKEAVDAQSEFDQRNWRMSESALQQFCQEKGLEFHLVEVKNAHVFKYAKHFVYHINFEARLQNAGVAEAEPSMMLFFAEAMYPYPKSPFITCCRPIEPMDKVTEGCIFCRELPEGRLIIHPISDVMEIDKRFLPELNPHDAYIETVMKFPGIPPWQINRGPVVQSYNPLDTGVTGERSQECDTRLYQLSESILMHLKNIKGMDLNLVRGVNYFTLKSGVHTVHHLNFEANHHDEPSTRLYFAEVINYRGADCLMVCCVVDPADKVLDKFDYRGGDDVIQPDIRVMDPKNVIYVNLEMCLQLLSDESDFWGFPCLYPSCNGRFYF